MKAPKLRKSRSNNKAKNVKKSRTKRILKGGVVMNPALAIEPVFQYFINQHNSIDIFAGEMAPLIKENANIRIISIHTEEGQDELIQNIQNDGIEGHTIEIINVPNPNEKIYFLTEENFNINVKNDFRMYDFDTLLCNSNNNIIRNKAPQCKHDVNFPLINFFYSEALTLAYWNKIYKDLNLISSGKKLNIFNLHSTINASSLIKHFATANSINIMISCNCLMLGENYNTIISILARNKVNTPIFIGFPSWITVWGSNLMARKIKDQVSLPEPGKECNNLLNKIQALYYYMDTAVRSKYTQDIITRNIRDMIADPREPIQFVDESLCAKENLGERAKLLTPYSCPDEIKYVPKSKPHVLLPTDPSNIEELAFRTKLYLDIETRLNQTHYNIHLQVLNDDLTPKILECIQFYISNFDDKYKQFLNKLMIRDIKDIEACSNLISSNFTTGWDVIDKAIGLEKYLDTIKGNFKKLCPNQWYTEKLNITLDFIEITINPRLQFPHEKIKFDIHTGITMGDKSMLPIKNIDDFMIEMAKYDNFDVDDDE